MKKMAAVAHDGIAGAPCGVVAVTMALLFFSLSSRVGAASSGGWPAPWYWSRVEVEGTAPASRQGHSVVAIGERIYMIGGCLQEVRCYNDLNVFDTETLRWSQLGVEGDPPEPRGGHSATAVGADVILYGGANSRGTFGDLHRLDLVKRRWTRVTLDGSIGPGQRTGHAAAADDRGRIYVFGGYDADGTLLSDLWELSLEASEEAVIGTWSRPATSGVPPSARVGHTMTYLDGKLVVVGGYTMDGMTTSDTYAYDLGSNTWTLLEVPNRVPAPRQGHSALRHGKDILVAGGCDVSSAMPTCFNDVWSFSLGDSRWTQKSFDEVTWFPRQGHSAAFVRGRMFTFGGCDLSSACYGDVASLDTLDPCPSNCGGPASGTCISGTFCKCTVPLFSGHDCMQALRCPSDCGAHGFCSSPGGACTCENGWTGPSCSTELPCPSGRSPAYAVYGNFGTIASGAEEVVAKCSGRGICLTNGQCRCSAGFGGPACDEPSEDQLAMSLTNGSSSSSSVVAAISSSGVVPTTGSRSAAAGTSQLRLAFVDPFQHHHHATETRVEEKPKGINDFGVTGVNEKGRSGNGKDHCKDFCNFRGLCEDKVCYCQPGFFGKTCANQEQTEDGTLSLPLAGLISIASLLTSFFVMLFVKYFEYTKKRKKEIENGYEIR